MKDYFFSVVIPVYNKGFVIERTLKSVLLQNYENYEIIVVNDGSTDNTLEVINRNKSNKLYVYSQENSGVSVARNKGVKESHYDYVVFLDGDDTWESDFLFYLNLLVNKYPTAGVYGINHNYVFEEGSLKHEDNYFLDSNDEQFLISDYFKTFVKLGRSPFSNSGCCFPKKIFNEFGGYKEGVRLTEDSGLWTQIALKYDVAFDKRKLVNYFFETPGNTLSVYEKEEPYVIRILKNKISSNEVPDHFIQSVQNLILFLHANRLKRAVLVGDRSFVFKNFYKNKLVLKNFSIVFICLGLSLIPQKIVLFLKNVRKKLK